MTYVVIINRIDCSGHRAAPDEHTKGCSKVDEQRTEDLAQAIALNNAAYESGATASIHVLRDDGSLSEPVEELMELNDDPDYL